MVNCTSFDLLTYKGLHFNNLFPLIMSELSQRAGDVTYDMLTGRQPGRDCALTRGLSPGPGLMWGTGCNCCVRVYSCRDHLPNIIASFLR